MRKLAIAIAITLTTTALITIPACIVHTPGMGDFSCDLKVDSPGFGHVQCEHVEGSGD